MLETCCFLFLILLVLFLADDPAFVEDAASFDLFGAKP